jgi:hypothetical protein
MYWSNVQTFGVVWLMKILTEDVILYLRSRGPPNYWPRWIDSAFKGWNPWYLTSHLAHHTSVVRFPCVISFESRMCSMIIDTILNSRIRACHENRQVTQPAIEILISRSAQVQLITDIVILEDAIECVVDHRV